MLSIGKWGKSMNKIPSAMMKMAVVNIAADAGYTINKSIDLKTPPVIKQILLLKQVLV